MFRMLITTRSKSQSYSRKVRLPCGLSADDSFTSWTWTLALFAATTVEWLPGSL